ncbi:MAG: M20/M25/M40 family metallo-hydrolase [Armatimonadetes bacterium]|nr:M20/M25/M40 family metallo-hydrolase [Armatimonadota bacterium]
MIATAALIGTSLFSQVSIDHLKATLQHLSTYPTRNTSTPELKQAAEWVASEFRKIPGLKVEIMEYDVKKGRRVPEDKTVVQVIATLPGETDHKVIVGGHLDTINLGGDVMTAKAPGINDDGSGVALTLESARILSQRKWHNTFVFVAFSGEEQGLFGSTALAERAKKEGWNIDAVLSNDTVGSSMASDMKDKKRVRLYSEEVTDPNLPQHNSRELARFIEWNSRGKLKGFAPWLVFRRDRFQRGGDHTPFNKVGYTAVRFVEAIEWLEHQHTEKDTLEWIDFNYLANVTKLNILSMEALGDAAEAPDHVRYDLKQAHDTTIHWTAKPGVKYVVYWRETSSPTWQGAVEVGETDHAVIKGKNKDDHTFAVGTVGGIPIPLG